MDFLRRSHLVVFLDPYFLGVNACNSMIWRILTDKHTPCCRLPSHTSAARICSRRSQAQYPRRGSISTKYQRSATKLKTYFDKGVKAALNVEHLGPSLAETRSELQKEPLRATFRIHSQYLAYNIAISYVCNHTCK